MDSQIGFLRLHQVLELIPISKTYFYAGIAAGIFPAPLKLGRASMWPAESIRLAMENIVAAKRETKSAAA